MVKPSSRNEHRAGLRDEQRTLADARILEGAAVVFAEKGLDGTVDDVAAAAGVSRRTVFRHFESHGELFAAAVERILREYERGVPKTPGPEQDVDDWLLEVAETMHDLNRRLLGRGFWQVQHAGPGTSAEVRAALANRVERQTKLACSLAKAAWRAKGGAGRSPRWVEAAFVIWVSGIGSGALDGYGVDEAAQASAQILSAVIARAAEAQDRPIGPGSRGRSRGRRTNAGLLRIAVHDVR